MKKRFARQNIIKLSNYKRKCEMKKKQTVQFEKNALLLTLIIQQLKLHLLYKL